MRIGIFSIFVLMSLVLVSCQKATPIAVSTSTVEATIAPTSTTVPTRTGEPIATLTSQSVPCLGEGGRVEQITFKSALLNASYTVSIYTPPCYGKEAQTKYPVLYLLHGQNMDDTYWLGLGAAEIVDDMIREGGPAFLMVMPYEVKNFDPPLESRFGESIISELIPWVEENYAVCAERACRAIGGISRGGGWAIRLAMRNFDTFGAVGGHSPGIMAGDWWQAQKHLETHSVDDYPRIYIDRGEDDFLAPDIDSFVKVLERNGIPHEFHKSPGSHNKAYWQEHVAEYLQWYAEGWE